MVECRLQRLVVTDVDRARDDAASECLDLVDRLHVSRGLIR
jgi:hypothetical protein